MNRFIPEDTILDIQQATDIVELISEYLPLKKTGANFKALCPFHEEKTPSFVVNPTKQIYHCFGCQKGGNAFSFLMEHEKMDFPTAARALAEKAGIRLNLAADIEGDYTREKRANLLKINRQVADFYHRILQGSKEAEIARAYLEKRKISKSMIARFLIGYAPDGWNNLIQFAQKNNVNMGYLEELGLILPRKGQNGHYDRFRNRLMFPIFNTRDRVVGFGGRALDDSEPVYLNSPESALFSKGKTLYGLNFAKESSDKTGRLCVVEGYTDVIMAHQYGFENFIATLGTSLTPNHIKSIKRFTNQVLLVYDADQGGEIASERLLSLFLPEEIDLFVARLPTGLDPYDCLTQKGPEVFKKCLANAQDLFTCRLDIAKKKHNTNSTEGKIKAIDELLLFVRAVPNIVRRNLYLKQISESFNIKDELLKMRLKDASPARTRETSTHAQLPAPINNFSTADKEAAEEIIGIMLTYNNSIPIIKKLFTCDDRLNQQSQTVIEMIFEAYEKYGKVTMPVLMSFISSSPELTGWVVQITEQGKFNNISNYEERINWLKSFFTRRREEEKSALLKKQLHEAQIKGDQEGIDRILKEFQSPKELCRLSREK
ncbi:MAG: DNA primase [Planctomycetota bacterium]